MSKSVWGNAWFLIPALVFINICLALLLVVPHGREILFFNQWRTEPWNWVFRFCTRLGEPSAYTALAIAMLFRRYRFSVLIAMAALIIIPTSYLLKDKIGEDRPVTFFEKQGIRTDVVVVPDVSLNSGQTSFPSGHTMSAFGIYGAIALAARTRQGKRWGLLCAVTAILVGFSRIFLVQHFLADVMAGAVLGVLIAILVNTFDNLYFRKWNALDRALTN